MLCSLYIAAHNAVNKPVATNKGLAAACKHCAAGSTLSVDLGIKVCFYFCVSIYALKFILFWAEKEVSFC